MKRILGWFIAGSASLVTGCATVFHGNAKVLNGPASCQTICAGWDMELAGMVQLGEYSDGCVCQVPGKRVSVSEAVSAAASAASGVAVQTQRATQGTGGN